ncbi:MAG: hypothetical protein OER88_02900, partial [Planctomycetota bacterium]|nr:hypothetical protein [Planctomycetota bacterium]
MRTLATLCVLLLAAAGCTRSNANRIGNLARSANPQVAMDGSGNGIAVWQEGGDIVARFFLLATGFGDGEGITDALENYKPDVAMSVDGSAIVTWVARLAAGDVLVKARRYSPGRGWESERILDRGPPSVLDLPAAEFDDPDGAKRYEPVGSALDPQCPQVAMDDAGNGVVVWARGGRVCAVSYSAGDWSAPIVIDEPPDDRVGVLPRIAMHPDGAALVTYSIYGDPANVVVEGPTPQFPTQTELDVRGVFVAEFDPARRSFFVPEVVTTDAWFPERADPDIAVDPSGMFMIVWLRGGVTGGIRSQTSSLHYRCYRA